MTQEATDRAARRVGLELRGRALEVLAKNERALDAIFEGMAERVRKELRVIGFSTAQVEEVLRRAFSDTIDERLRLVERSIQNGAREGAQTDRGVFDRVFGGAEVPPGTFQIPVSATALAVASRRIRGSVAVDGLNLSRRFHRNDGRTLEAMRTQLVASIRSGESILRTADRILELDAPTVEIPRYVEDISAAARTFPRAGPGVAERPRFHAAVARWRRQIGRLGQRDPRSGSRVGAFTIRSATQEFVKRLERALPQDVDRIVDRWVLDRARYQARLVARHETVEAFRDAAIASSRDKPWVKGYRWALSNRHPKADECDTYAAQDLHGLGPGGYPEGDLPRRHPGDLCTITPIVDRNHLKRETAALRGEPEPPRLWETKAEPLGAWHRRNEALARQILGPTRSRVFFDERAQPSTVLEDDGTPRPVWQVLGEGGPPPRGFGRRVGAGNLVARSAAARARALPRAPELGAGTGSRGERNRLAEASRRTEDLERASGRDIRAREREAARERRRRGA